MKYLQLLPPQMKVFLKMINAATFVAVLFMISSSAQAQRQAGMVDKPSGGQVFNAEQYKIDRMAQQYNSYMSNYNRVQTASKKADYFGEKGDTEGMDPVEYKSPNYPMDTIAEVYDTMYYNAKGSLFHKLYKNSGSSGVYDDPPRDSMEMGTYDKVYNTKVYRVESLGDPFYPRISNVLNTYKIRQISGKAVFDLVVNVQHSPRYYRYKLSVTPKGKYTVEVVKFHHSYIKQKSGTILSYQKDSVNSFSFLLQDGYFRFLRNGEELFMVQLEHPWACLVDDPLIYVNDDCKLMLYGYNAIFFPETKR